MKNTQVIKALTVARVAHAGQTYGISDPKPYFEAHLSKVAKLAAELATDLGMNDDFVRDVESVAWLHDSVEDTEVSLDDLRNLGFSEMVVDGVDRMTKREGEDYMVYLTRVEGSELSRLTKLADLNCNLAAIADKPHLEAKYQKARAYLQRNG